MGAWYKLAGTLLFHCFYNGMSLCGVWSYSKPAKPLKEGMQARKCGECLKRSVLAHE